MFSTQTFANLAEVSKKTIIYYDRIGLLKPLKYYGRNRLYNSQQVLIVQKIKLLKSFGLTLSEIKKYLNRDPLLQDLFTQRLDVLTTQNKRLEKRINKINEFIDNLKEKKMLIAPLIKIVKPYSIYALEKVGRYVDIEKHQQELFHLIGDKKFQSVGLTIFKDNDYSPDRAQMITGAIIKTKPKKIKGVQIINFPSYRTISYTHIGSYSYLSYIWQILNRYVVDNKLKINLLVSSREFYLLGKLYESNEDNYITELQVPII